MVGTTVRVVIAGNWTTYKSRIVQYMQQSAIITPYAALSLTYAERSGKTKLALGVRLSVRTNALPTSPDALNRIVKRMFSVGSDPEEECNIAQNSLLHEVLQSNLAPSLMRRDTTGKSYQLRRRPTRKLL
jgi:hypothetical protein